MKNKNDIELRSAELRFDSANPESRHVEGYAAKFNVDSVYMGFVERLMPGSITEETLRNSDVLARVNHSDDKVVARYRGSESTGNSLTLRVDEIGLWYSFDAPNTAAGNELLELLKRNDITQSSFGFYLDTTDLESQKIYKDADGTVRRDIYKIAELTDVSPVYHPAYKSTTAALRCVTELLTPEEQKALESFLDAENRSEETVEVSDNIEEPVTEQATVEEEPMIENDTEKQQDAVEEPVTVEEPVEVSDNIEEQVSEQATVEEEPVNNNDNNTEEPQEQRSLEATNIKNKNISINRNMKNNEFSLLKALRSTALGEKMGDVEDAVLTAGIEEFRASGRGEMNANSIYLPAENRAITVGGLDDATDVIETEYQSLLEPLFASNVLLKNAKKLTGLRGDVKYPIISKTNPGAAWEGEIAENALSGNSFSSITLSPKRISTSIIISRQFLLQDSIGAETAIRNLLIQSLSSKLEATFMSADAGTATKPSGIFAGVTPDTVADFQGIADLEAKAVAANVNIDNLKYVLDPKAWATLRAGGSFTYNEGKGKTTRNLLEGSEIDGRPFEISNHLGNKKLALVNWDEIVVAQWGSLSIEVDSTSLAMSRAASVGLTVNAWFNCVKLRDESVFIANLGATNNVADPLDTSIGA